MFNLNLNNDLVRVSFHHDHPIRPGSLYTQLPGGRSVKYTTEGCAGGTTCFIRLTLAGMTEGQSFTVFGTSICIPKDCLHKALGRKLALARALDQTDFSVAEREAIWQAYRALSHA